VFCLDEIPPSKFNIPPEKLPSQRDEHHHEMHHLFGEMFGTFPGQQHLTKRWSWFQRFFIFTSDFFGEMIQFDEPIFFIHGLISTTTYMLIFLHPRKLRTKNPENQWLVQI